MSGTESSFLNRACLQKPMSTTCFSVAATAFVAAFVGAVMNYVLAEVMAVVGMVMVGLFYLGMGIWYRGAVETGPLEADHTNGAAKRVFVMVEPEVLVPAAIEERSGSLAGAGHRDERRQPI